MELLKEFMLFGVSAIIENGIMLYFCKVVFGIEKIKWWHVLVLCLPLLLFQYLLNVSVLKQVIMSLIIIVYLVIILKRNILGVLMIFLSSSMFLLVFEVCSCIIYDCINIDIANLCFEKRLMYLIPIRVLQIIILIIVWRVKSWGSGGLTKRLKKK